MESSWLIIVIGLICIVLFIIGVVYLLVLISQKLRRKYQIGGEGSPKEVQPHSKNNEYQRKTSGLKCPKCRRYDVEYKEGFYQCPWKDCFWKSREYEDPGMTEEEEKAVDRLLKNLEKKR
jgi:hypothetical protein